VFSFFRKLTVAARKTGARETYGRLSDSERAEARHATVRIYEAGTDAFKHGRANT